MYYHQQRKSKIRFRVILFCGFILTLVGFVFFLYFKNRDFLNSQSFKKYLNILDKNPPLVELVNNPKGVGLEAPSFSFKVHDAGAGIDEIIVRYSQNRGQPKELFKKFYYGDSNLEEIELKLPSKVQGIREGKINVSISAYDYSIWSNEKILESEFKVSYKKPKVLPLSVQHNISEGGSEMVFYQAQETLPSKSGVVVGDTKFYGYPATNLGGVSDQTLFFVFFPVRFGIPEGTNITLFAEDEFGNTSFSKFHHRIRRVKRAVKKVVTMSSSKGSKSTQKNTFIVNNSAQNSSNVPSSAIEACLNKAQAFIKDYQKTTNTFSVPGEVEKGSFAMISNNFQFLRQPNLRTKTDYGTVLEDPRNLKVQPVAKVETLGKSATSNVVTQKLSNKDANSKQTDQSEPEVQLSDWVKYAPLSDTAKILATNSGKVIFADATTSSEITCEGFSPENNKLVVLDHGFGLFSVFLGVSDLLIAKGDFVNQGQLIASLEGKDSYLYYQMLISSIPVRPLEWFDKYWIKDHVLSKIHDIKSLIPN